MSLFEITAVCQNGDKTLSIYTSSKSLRLGPLLIRFNGDSEMEAWQADIVNGEKTREKRERFHWIQTDLLLQA